MPELTNLDAYRPGLTPLAPPLPEAETPPDAGEVWRSAFALGNDVWQAFERSTYPVFEPQPGFSPLDVIKDTRFESDYLENFIGVESEAETRWVMSRIEEEEKQNQDLAAAGGMGGLANVVAGIASPTSLIPITGWLKWVRPLMRTMRPARIALAAGESAALTAGAVGIQEAVLQSFNETRTDEETFWAIAGAAVIGGVLGPIASRAFRDAHLDAMAASVSRLPATTAEQAVAFNEMAALDAAARRANPRAVDGDFVPAGATGLSAQASAAERGSGEIAGAFGSERILRVPNPQLRTATSILEDTRQVSRELVENPNYLADNADWITTANRGAVESLIRVETAYLAKAVRALDDAYSRYFFGKTVPMARLRAATARFTGNAGEKIDYTEFKRQVSEALLRGDEGPIPEVSSAAKQVREYFNRYQQQAIDLRVPGFMEGMKAPSGDQSYFPRYWNHEKIRAHRERFRNVLASNFRERQEKLVKRIEARRAARADQLEQEVRDLELSGPERAALIESLTNELKGLKESNPAFRDLDTQLTALRSQLSDARQAGSQAGRAQEAADLATEIKRATEGAGQAYADYVSKRNLLASRRRRLVTNIAGREDQVERIRGNIADTEAANVDRLWKLHQMIGNLERQIDGADNLALPSNAESLAAALADAKTQFAKVLARSTAAQERLAAAKVRRAEEIRKLKEDGRMEEAARLEDQADEAANKFEAEERRRVDEMNELADEIGGLERVDLDEGIPQLKNLIERRLAQSAETVEEAGRRMARMAARLAKADPEKVKAKVANLRDRIGKIRHGQLPEFARLEKAEIDDLAEEVIGSILGSPFTRIHLPPELGSGPRASLRARTLNIPTDVVKEFVEMDIERVLRAHHRTVPPDLALISKFGNTDLKHIVGDGGVIDQAARRARARVKNPESKAGQKEIKAIDKAADEDKRDISAMTARMRNTYALPANPEGRMYRAGNFIKDVNYLRIGGGFTLASLPDVMMVPFQNGMARAFGGALAPLVDGLKHVKLAAREAKLAGANLEMELDTRVMAWADITDDYGYGNKFERGLRGAQNKFGLVNLLTFWNSLMKGWASNVVQTRMLETVTKFAESGRLTRDETAWLAANNIDENMARRMAGMFNRHGLRGKAQWVANTEKWLDDTADVDPARVIEAFRVALGREVDRTILTPGQGRPLLTSTQLGSVVGQFRVFQFASAQRVLLSGLQQRDMAALNGIMGMVGMGMLTYWFRAQISGQDVPSWEENPSKWIVEGVDRSGVLGWFMEVNNLTEKLTGGRVGASALTGSTASRYASRNAISALLGPTVGLFEDTAQVTSSLLRRDPDKGGPLFGQGWNASDTSAARRLLFLQNVFYIRGLFDAAENGINEAAGIPQRAP